nr:MAG TPA: hypothetical protein [Caudoviricetes sp.]
MWVSLYHIVFIEKMVVQHNRYFFCANSSNVICTVLGGGVRVTGCFACLHLRQIKPPVGVTAPTILTGSTSVKYHCPQTVH